MHLCAYVCMYVSKCVCMCGYVSMYVYVNVCLHMCTYVYVYVCMYICTVDLATVSRSHSSLSLCLFPWHINGLLPSGQLHQQPPPPLLHLPPLLLLWAAMFGTHSHQSAAWAPPPPSLSTPPLIQTLTPSKEPLLLLPPLPLLPRLLLPTTSACCWEVINIHCTTLHTSLLSSSVNICWTLPPTL